MRLKVEWDNPNGVRIWRWKLYADVEMPYTIDGSHYRDREFVLVEGELEFRPGEVTDDAISRLLSNGPLLEQGKP